MVKTLKFLESTYVIFFLLVLISLLYVYTIINHEVFGEWDGVMHYFSGKHLLEHGVYAGWASYFWPPLQPLILAIGEPFFTGKLVSLISGFVTLLSLFLIANYYLQNNLKSLSIVAYIFSLTLFFEVFTMVENHALEVAFFMLSYLIFLYSENHNSLKLFFICGILVAIASMSRYTSYALALSLVLIIFIRNINFTSLKNAVIFSMAFLLVSSMWWIPNYVMNGSPLHTWQYLNVGSRIYPGESNDFWWWYQKDVHGLVDLISSYPSDFIYNFFKNLVIGSIHIASGLTSSIYMSILVIFLYVSYILRNSLLHSYILFTWPVVLISIIFLIITSLAFNFKEALAPVIFLILIASLIFYYMRSSSRIYIITSLTILNTLFSFFYVNNFVKVEKTDGSQLTDLHEVNSILLEIKKEKDILSSINPARGYYASMNWVMSPLGGALELCDFVDFNYPDKIVNYAPKYPVDLKNIKIDYVIITSGMDKYHSFIDTSLKLNVEKCEKYDFKLLYHSLNTALYKVNR